MSCNNIASVSRTLAHRIWQGIKDDERLKIIQGPEQIIFHLPKREDHEKSAQICVLLYNVNEYSSMRNQPQNPQGPRTLLYLNLRYLITPLTHNAETDQIILGKIMQLFAGTPILRGQDLQGSLREGGDELRVILDPLGMDDLNKLWTLLWSPYRLSVGYSVFPVRIDEPKRLEKPPVLPKKPRVPTKKSVKA